MSYMRSRDPVEAIAAITQALREGGLTSPFEELRIGDLDSLLIAELDAILASSLRDSECIEVSAFGDSSVADLLDTIRSGGME